MRIPTIVPNENGVTVQSHNAGKINGADESLRRGYDSLMSLVHNAPLGVYLVDADFRLLQISAGSQKVFDGIQPLIGRDFAEILRIVWLEPFATEAIERFRHTLATGDPYHSPETTEQRGNAAVVESYDWQIARVTMPDGRLGVVCYFYETTARVHGQQDARFLAELGERCRTATAAHTLLRDAVYATGVYLRADRCFVNQIFEDLDRWTIADDYYVGLTTLAGHYRLSDYDASARASLGDGIVEVVTDATIDPRSSARFAAAYEPLGIRAHVVVPLLRDGRWVANMIVASGQPRAWQSREIALLEIAAERIWNTVERLRLDASLRESEQRLQALVRHLPGGAVFVVDRELRYLLAEGEAIVASGLVPQSFVGRTISEVLPPIAAKRHEFNCRAALAGHPFEDEHPVGTRTFLSRGVPLRAVDGSIDAALVVSYDISERKQAEESLRRQDDLIRNVNDNTSELIFMKDLAGRLTYANAATLGVIGATSLPPGVDLDTFSVPEEHAAIAENDRLAMASGRVVEAEEVFTSADGHRRVYLSTKSPLRDGAGTVIGVIGVSRDITERKRAEDALRENDRRKDEFLAMLAHELRNPLAPIRTATRVLMLAGPTDATQRRACEVIERQTQHLTRLVDDLLDVSRITQRKVTLQREPLDLAAIVDRAVEANRGLADARRQHLTIILPSEPVQVEGDLTRLVQVASNLLNNAVKYTHEGGHIVIEAGADGTQALLHVRDDGTGIAAELLPSVFDLFTQADRSLDRSQGGLGIGLTLVRLLVEMHGGQVEARSAGPELGSEFTVRLPLLDLHPAQTAEAGVADAPASEVAKPRALRVLIVEDNLDSAEMLGFLLTLSGHETRLASDGEQGLEAASQFRPHVVLCDLGLPRMDGYELARRLRAHPDFKHTRLIALSGYGREEDRRHAQQAGFDYHLVKPVDPNDVSALIDSLSRARQAPF